MHSKQAAYPASWRSSSFHVLFHKQTLSQIEHLNQQDFEGAMHLHQLSDLSFRIIFANIPNRHLLTSSTVCQKWNFFAADTARHRHSLVLALGSKEAWSLFYRRSKLFDIPFKGRLLSDDGITPLFANYVPSSELKSIAIARCPLMEYPFTTSMMVSTLSQYFTNVTTFSGLSTNLLNLKAIIQLLEKLKSTLVTLEIRVIYSDSRPANERDNEKTGSGALLECINSMPSLVHLTVDVNVSLLGQGETTIDLPVLGRLHELYWYSHDWADSLVDSLRKYALPKASLRVLYIHSSLKDQQTLRHFPAHFTLRFKELSLAIGTHNQSLLLDDPIEQPLPPFASLTTLYLRAFNYNLTRTELLRYLQPLTQLQYLSLCLPASQLEAWSQEREEEEHRHLTGPPSLRVITIAPQGPLRSHTIFGRLRLLHYFSKLQVMLLSNSSTKQGIECWQMCQDCAENSCGKFRLLKEIQNESPICITLT